MIKEQIKQEVREKFQQYCNRCKTPNCGLYNVKSICQEAFYINIIASQKSAIDEVIKKIEKKKVNFKRIKFDNLSMYQKGYWRRNNEVLKDVIQIIKDKLKEK